MSEITIEQQAKWLESALISGSDDTTDDAEHVRAILSTLRSHAELVRDARRYRWLRKGEPNVIHSETASQQSGSGPFTTMILPGVHARQVVVYEDVLDQQIDAALPKDSP